MFEKEAEEIANKRCHEIMCYGHCSFNSPKHHRCGDWHREYNCAKEGIEFGYNKANEWHYTKYELPPEDVPLICMRGGNIYVAWFILGKWKGDKYNDVKKPYAWKEIVLPKECEK